MPPELIVEMLPAGDGDAILVTCRWDGGDFHVLVDGGRVATEPALRERLAKLGHLDLLVVSHIDGDHIGGIVELMRQGLPVTVGEVWFNGLEHLSGGTLPPAGFRDLAPADGVALSGEIVRHGLSWNASFGGGPVCVGSPGQIVRKTFGHVTIDLLAPDLGRLGALARGKGAWTEDTKARPLPARFRAMGDETPDIAALSATPDHEDASVTNGTSIAFVLTVGPWCILLAADAHPSSLSAGLRALGATLEAPIRLSACKVSHHGGRWNTTKNMLRLITCENFLVSTDGKGSEHPHDETLAKIVTSQSGNTRLTFNYRHKAASRWDLPELKASFGFDVAAGTAGIAVRLCPEGENRQVDPESNSAPTEFTTSDPG